MRVAVIGAGACGLPAIKTCLEEGLNPVCFEKRNEIGGLWNYQETPTEGQSNIMWSTISNTSKETMCYSDFPFPDNFPNFLHHTKVLEYLKMYASHFDLEKYIRFSTEVVEVVQSDDFNETGQWIVQVKDSASGTMSSELFDAVLVCSGRFSEPLIPEFRGAATFKGKQFHSKMYKTSAGFENKRVLLVGLGNSCGDIAGELAHVCSQVYISTRRGAWITPRLTSGGITRDSVVKRRVTNALNNAQPRFLKNYLLERQLTKQFDHSLYGLKPDHYFDAQHPLTNDVLPQLLASGRVALKGDIKLISETGVIFDDGSDEENIDAIIYTTGFKIDFPFLKHSSYKVYDNLTNLYKFVFAPDVKPNTLAVIGCIQPYGSMLPVSELQTRWAIAVMKGETTLPTEKEMQTDVEKRRLEMAGRYLNSPRHALQVEWIDYMDEIARMIDCKPDWVKLLTKDPRLALSVVFGPCIPSQYRLMGKGAWPGARNTVLTTWKRILEPMNKKGVHQSGNQSVAVLPLLLGLLLVVACVVLYMS